MNALLIMATKVCFYTKELIAVKLIGIFCCYFESNFLQSALIKALSSLNLR